MIDFIEKMFRLKQKQLMREIFKAFQEGCVGFKSLKTIKDNRGKLLESIRRELREKYQKQGQLEY